MDTSTALQEQPDGLYARFTRGFSSEVKRWRDEGRISAETAGEFLQTLDDPEVRAYLGLFVQLFAVDAVVRPEFVAALTSFAGSAAMAIGQVVRGALLHLLVQLRGQDVPRMERQLLAVGAMVPFGDNLPLLFLYRKYPGLARAVYAYMRNGLLRRIQDRMSVGEDLGQHYRLYLRLVLGHPDPTPEMLASFERERFRRFFGTAGNHGRSVME